MKKIFLVLSLVLVSSSAFAAKFKNISSMKNKELAAAQKVAKSVLAKESIFGDRSSAVSYSFVKLESEELLNSIKQLNVAKYGVWPTNDETTDPAEFRNMGELITYLMDTGHGTEFCSDLFEESEKTKCRAELKKLGGALKAALGTAATTEVELFTSRHCEEDGCWQLIDIVDVKANQVLVLQRGYSGT